MARLFLFESAVSQAWGREAYGRPSTLSLPAAFSAIRHPLPPGRHCLHRHYRGQTCHHPLPKKEATAAAPRAYQQQHQRENVCKSRRLGLFNLSTVLREFSNYQVVSLKKLSLFCNLHTRRCLALRFWEVVLE
jgi:hypothetical protein